MSGSEATPSITLPFEEPVAEIDRQIQSLKEREDAQNYESELFELCETRNNHTMRAPMANATTKKPTQRHDIFIPSARYFREDARLS